MQLDATTSGDDQSPAIGSFGERFGNDHETVTRLLLRPEEDAGRHVEASAASSTGVAPVANVDVRNSSPPAATRARQQARSIVGGRRRNKKFTVRLLEILGRAIYGVSELFHLACDVRHTASLDRNRIRSASGSSLAIHVSRSRQPPIHVDRGEGVNDREQAEHQRGRRQ